MPGLEFGPILPACPAYVGPSAGLELAPYSWGLLAWVGVALIAVLFWPLLVLYQRFRKTRAQRMTCIKAEQPFQSTSARSECGDDQVSQQPSSDSSD